MKITVKLYALLGRYLPAGSKKNTIDIEVENGVTPAEVLTNLGVPLAECHLVLVNGEFVTPEARKTRALVEDDALAVWPPVAGG